VAALQSAQLMLGVAHAGGGGSASTTPAPTTSATGVAAVENAETTKLLAGWSRDEVGLCVVHAAHELGRAGAAAADEPRAAALATQYTALLLLLLRVWAAAAEHEESTAGSKAVGEAEAEGEMAGVHGPCVAAVRAVAALLRDEAVRAPHASSSTSLATSLLTVLLLALQLALRCVYPSRRLRLSAVRSPRVVGVSRRW